MDAGDGDALKSCKEALQSSISDLDTFTYLVSSTLSSLDLHPTSIPSPPSSTTVKSVGRYLPSIQISLLTLAVPTFLHALDASQQALLRSFFVPTKQAGGLATGRIVALTTYLTLPALLSTKSTTQLPRESREYVIETLSRLVDYGIGDIYWAVWSTATAEASKQASARQLQWEESVGALVGLPGKVANAVGKWKAEGWTGNVPETLVPKPYFDRLVVDLEGIMYQLSQDASSSSTGSRIRMVFRRLASLGLFTSHGERSPSFWPAALPPLLAHIHPPGHSPLPPYPSSYLPSILLALPTSAFTPLVESLLNSLVSRIVGFGNSSPSIGIYRAASVIQSVIGPAEAGGEAIQAIIGAILNARGTLSDRKSEALVRAAVAWIGQSGEKPINFLIDSLMDAWTDPKYIRFALYAQQFTLTHALLLALSLLPQYAPYLVHISHRPRFLSAMQLYLAHPDPSIRRLGMLVAEIVSELTIEETGPDLEFTEKDEIDELKAGLENEDSSYKPKPRGGRRLRFGGGMWDGEGDGKEEARWLRECVGVKDSDAILPDEDERGWMLGWDRPESKPVIVEETPTLPQARERGRQSKPKKEKSTARPKIIMLDDEQEADALQGYDPPSPSSSRSPSPTPSYLEEVAADPTLALDSAQKKKLTRPVYISQLVLLLKEREKPDHIEMALRFGESLIRAKRSFGGELEENATTLAAMIVALNDPFNLEDFDEKRQGMLNALTACAPRVIAPYLSEIYFTGQYSLHQRSVILTALSMGARELAGMTVPQPKSTRKNDFPSKTLPPALHRRYVTLQDVPGQLEEAVDGVRGLLLSKGAKRGEEALPEIAREKKFRVGASRRNLVAEAGTLAERQMADRSHAAQAPVVPFKDVAAEYFVMPLINRFWQYFQDSNTREARAVVRGDRWRGAGTGMILSPMALEKLLMTLTLLLHAARHATTYLAVLAPETLELAVTLASRHLASPDNVGQGENDKKGEKESSVIGSALEMALVVLDASFDLDAGRTLAMTRPDLLMAVGEWANGVFQTIERKGERLAGEGGMREGRVRAAAAGVVVKVADIGDKWGRVGVF